MSELENRRQRINSIDAEMARLFEERMQVSREIAEYKRSHGLSVRDPAREAEMVSRNRGLVKEQAVEGYYVQFLRDIIDLSCDYQSQVMHGMRVTYSGTEGAYAYMAAKRMFPEAELSAFPDFTEAYRAVERGEYDCAVLPLENSYAGEVGAVMDLIFSGDLYVNQVVDVSINHSLIAGEGATPDSIRKVVSHPQALQQCADYIRRHGYETLTYSNTALAARYVKELGDPTVAAIASDETASLFGLKVLDTEINDSKNNTTRFAAFSRARNRPLASGKREDENFILVFTVQNQAGSLAGALNIIGAHGFNMRNLRSRPMKDLQWNYYFYIEAEGNINTENGRDMLRELSALCAKLKLVGSYYAGNVQ